MKHTFLMAMLCLFFGQNIAQTYYSKGSENWNDVTNWHTNADGTSGLDMTDANDLIIATYSFVIQTGDVIIVNDSMNINNLTVDGTLTYGNSTTAHATVVNGSYNVSGTGTVTTGAFAATHTIQMKGDFTNNGSVSLRNSSSQVVNVYLMGATSISGSSITQFNNLEFKSGSVTANQILDVDGGLIIESGATFIAGDYTHTMAGNFSNNGTFTPGSGSGTINFDASLVQAITSNTTFNNLTISNGGVVSFGANVTANGNLLITDNTKVTTSSTNQVNGNFTVESGSSYEASNGELRFYGTGPQAITVTDETYFDYVRFNNGGANKKTIIGNLTFNDYALIYNTAEVESSGIITFRNGFDLGGTWDFTGTVYMKGGTYRDDQGGGDNTFSMGTAEIIIEGSTAIQTNDLMIVDNDVTINSGYLVINNNSALQGTGGDDILSVNNTSSLYMRGTDNFPTGFGTYTFEETSTQRYDLNGPQTVRGGITYGNLYLRYDTKTVDGSLDINRELTLESSSTLELLSFDHTLKSHLRNGSANGSITTTGGTFTLDGEDQDQYIYNGASYTFNNLIINNLAPTDVRTKRFYGDVTVNNYLFINNSTSNQSLKLGFDIDDHLITGGDSINLGENVEFRSSGTDNFKTGIESFRASSLDPNSTVQFDGEAQSIPSISYGNIELYGNGAKTFDGNIDINGYINNIGQTPVLTSSTSNLVISIAGDWLLETNYVDIDPSCSILFDGDAQQINSTTLPNITLKGSGTKNLEGQLTIEGDLAISNGVDFDADNEYINIHGNWENNSTGTFHQNSGRTNFIGNEGQHIAVQNTANSKFYDVYIDKASADTVYLTTDVEIERNLRFTEARGDLHLDDHTLNIGGDWYIYDDCELIYNAGATLHFNGSTTEQLLRNYNASTIYPNMEFTGSSLKRMYDEPFNIDGDFFLNGATVGGEYAYLLISGDWKNSGGTFNHYRSVTFDGANQSIDGTTFDDIVFSGTDTKTLQGNITLTGWLRIDSTSTLDVSPDAGVTNYNITIEEHWYNDEWSLDSSSTGNFVPRKGTVSFIGGSSNMYTGDTIDDAGLGRTGKQFYNLTINNNSNDNYTRLYAIEVANIKSAGCDLRVLNDFTINQGIFYTYWNKVYVTGNLNNIGGYFNMNEHRGFNSTLTLEGVSPNMYTFNPGITQYYRKIVIDGGASYLLDADLEILGNSGDNGELIINNGVLDLNNQNLTMTSTIGDITINTNGGLVVDSAAVLSMPNNRSLLNKGGNVELIGNSSTPARVTSTGNFYFIQEAGNFAAKYYAIENTRDSGLNIRSGSIDAINNLSYGSFGGGIGNSYLTLDELDLGGALTVNDVLFTESGSGPTYNVQRVFADATGADVITFQDASGTFSGETNENDPDNLIEWAYPSGKYWDGGATSSSWHDAANWFPDGVPDETSNVYLDNTHVGGSYTIDITSGAEAKNLVLEVSGVSLTLNGDSLSVNEDLTIKSGATLTQTDAGDTLRLKGNFFNSGNYIPNDGPLVYELLSNSFTIKNSDPIYQLFITGESGILFLSGDIYITDSIALNGATLNATNKDIYVSGSWTMDGGLFDAGSGDVIFDKDVLGEVQYVKGGDFYNFIARNQSTKEIASNISTSNNFDIEAGSNVDGKTSYLFVGRRWRNYEGETGFDQTGAGTVVFNRSGDTEVGVRDDKTTIFNNIQVQGSRTKYIRDNIKLKGDFVIQNGTNIYLYDDVTLDGIGTNNTFTMLGGAMYLMGANNFPSNIENIVLSGGSVEYRADVNQSIYPTNYYNIYARRSTGGVTTSKQLSGDIEVKNALIINDVDTELDVDGHKITLHNYISLPTGGIQINWGSGELIHVGGGWNMDADLTDFNDFTKKGDGEIYLNNNINISGNVVFFDETRLNMRTFALDCSGTDKNFSMAAGTRLYSYRASSDGVAFPTNFASYSLHETNLTYIRGNDDQEIFTGVNYGGLYLYDNSTKTVEINGDLTVLGNFYMSYDGITLNDNGYDLYLSGANNEFRRYTPTNTVYLNADIDQRIYASGAFTTLTFNNLDISGASIKNIDEGTIDIDGNISIQTGATMYSNDNILFSGSLLENTDGTLDHVGNIFTFDGVNQTIRPGVNNSFYGVRFSNSGTKLVENNGLDIYNGIFEIADGVMLDLGSLTHTIASSLIDIQGTGDWIESSASIQFDRNGSQYLPEMDLNDIQFSTSGYKYLRGNIAVNNLTIDNNVRLRTSETGSNAYNIALTGNWLNEGAFDAYDDTVCFESDDISAKSITSNGYNFYVAHFNTDQTASRTYTFNDNFRFLDSLSIGDGATVDLNGFNLIVGNNDANSGTAPFVPDGEELIINAGGKLIVDGGASLQFDLTDGNSVLDVYGTLEVIGGAGINANITRLTGYNTRGIEVTIKTGGTINAKNYHIQYLAPGGLVVEDGATIDATNNFSDGIWSNIYPGSSYTDPQDGATIINEFAYLDLQGDSYSLLPAIENVTFNHSGTPTVSTHYNIKRGGTASAELITLAGTINGLMGSETYELDPNNKLDWPPITLLTWTGNQSTDWFNANNWDGIIVPTSTNNVLIPLVSNNPLIYSDGAVCGDLEITNGILGIETGVTSLTINGNVLIGSDGILAIEDDVELDVSGNWSIATDATFLAGNGLVRFTAPTGSIVIEPRNSEFNNFTIDGAATFFYEGVNTTFNGDFTIMNGTFFPNDNNYTLTILGDFNQAGGVFSKSPNIGFVNFAGTDQSITDGDFSRVEFSNSGVKTINNSLTTTYSSNTITTNTLIVSGTANLTAASGASFDIAGNVSIEAGATFSDGNETHYFSGRYWTGLGAYIGAGTVIFDGRTQSIYEAKFSNLTLTEEVDRNDYKYLLDDVSLTGNLTIESYILDCDTYTITCSGGGAFSQAAANRLYIRGTNNYPTGFVTYNADVTSYTFYDAPIDQTIREATYGRLYLDGTSTKTLEGSITIKSDLYFYDNSVTLDANDQTINIAGNWNNYYSGTFVPGNGDVVFNGTATYQYISLGSTVDNEFYKLTIDTPDPTTRVRINSHDNIIQNELLVHSGRYETYGGYTTFVAGNMIAQNDGTIYQSGSYVMNNPSGTVTLKVNGSILNNLTINSGGTVVLAANDDLDIIGTFKLLNGTFNANGNTTYLGNYLDVITIEGEYIVGASGILSLGNQSTFAVKSGGTFNLVGDETNIATVTSRSGSYYFNIENGGIIHAQHYHFKNMRSSGIKVSSTGVIDATNNFSNGTFSNPTTGGTCLNIENSQEFTGDGSRIENVSFPDNPGSGTVNVRKDEGTSGILEFYNAIGVLAGADYESDPSNLINWTGDVTLTWTGDLSSNWFDTGNWDSSSGSNIIPDANATVIIPSGTTNFPIINADSAFAKILTLEVGSNMSIDNATPGGRSLIVLSDMLLEGSLTMINATDTLEVTGNWARGNNGNFSGGQGTVVLNGIGAVALDNRTSSFYNLEIAVNGSVELSSDLVISNDFIISSGSFDVSTNDRKLTVKGDFINDGSFIPQSGQVVLEASGAHNLNPGTTSFYDLEIKSGTYSLLSNNLQINRNFDITGGSLSIDALTLFMGDDSGYDNLSINGTLSLGDDAKLKSGSNAVINVYTGGTLSLIGSNNHEVILTNRTSGRYELIINSGGSMEADFYKVQYINATGIHFKPGSILDKTTNNLSNGDYSYGASGGRYLLFENNYTNDNDTVKILNVYFNDGATHNAKRDDAITDGVIEFKDALGVLASHYFEDDDGISNAGAITWTYTDPLLYWVGGNDGGGTDPDKNRWDNAQNWKDVLDQTGSIPNATTQVFINTVVSTKYPVLNTGVNGEVKNITIYSGASLTLGGGLDLTIASDLINAGTVTVETNSISTIEVGGQYANSGSFIHGGASTLLWTTTDNSSISTNGNAFYNLTINSGGNGLGTAVFTTGSSVQVDGNFNLIAGTVEVDNASHDFTISGHFNNQATFTNNNNNFLFNGNSDQNIISGTTFNFYDLEFTGSGAKNLDADIIINGEITLNSTLNADDNTISVKKDWGGTGTFNAESSTVKINGTNSQRITKAETFNDLVVDNNSGVNPLSLNGSVSIDGQLFLTNGIITTTPSKLIILNDGATVAASSGTSYINGPMRREGSTDFIFPIGSASEYSPIGVTSFTGTTTFTTQYFSTAPSNRTLLGTNLNKVSENEYWNIARNSGSGEPKLTLYWNDRAHSGITDVTVLSVAYYETGVPEWENYDTTSVNPSIDTLSGNVISGTSFTTFGDITIGFSYPTLTWNGSVSGDWSDPVNWTGDGIPTNQTNVVIQAGSTFYPIINTSSHASYDITIEVGGKLTIADNIEFESYGAVTTNDSLVLGTNSTIAFYDDFTQGGEIVNGIGSTISFKGEEDQDIQIDTCYNLILAGTNNKTLLSNIVIQGNINISNNLFVGVNDIIVYGNWLSNGSFNSGTATVTFKGTGSQSITEPSSNGFNNVVIDNSFATIPQINLGGNILISGLLTLTDGVIKSSESTRWSFADDAIVAGASDSSYIDGLTYRSGTNDFVFPLGKNNILAQIGISGMGATSGYFEAEYFIGTAADITNRQTGIETLSGIEYWDLHRSSGTGSPYVTLYWQDSSRSQIGDHTKLLVAHKPSTIWNNEGNGGSAINADSSGYVRSANQFTSFSPITLASSSVANPLPIELTDFSATVIGNDVHLEWTTLSETDNSHFIIERSNDGTIFSAIATVEGAGNSANELNYELVDKQPLIGTSYYRLIQEDYSGVRSTSDVISIVFEGTRQFGANTQVNVFPNPGSPNDMSIMVNSLESTAINIEVCNLTGKIIYAKDVKAENNSGSYTMKMNNVPNLSSGVYLLNVTSESNRIQRKFIIQ